MNDINYNLYDSIIAETIKELVNTTTNQEKIIIYYNRKDEIYNRFLLKMAFIVNDINHKPIYIKGNILTYLCLKVKYFKKRKIYYEFANNTNSIHPISLICKVLQVPSIKERTENPRIVEEIYNTYYSS